MGDSSVLLNLKWLDQHSLYQHHVNLGAFRKWYLPACSTQKLHPIWKWVFSPVANHGSQKQQTCLLLESVEIDRIMSSFGDGKPELGRLELRSRLFQVKSCPAIFLCDLSSSRFCTKNTWSVNPCSLINVRNLIEISKNNCKLCKEMKGMNYSILYRKMQGHYGHHSLHLWWVIFWSHAGWKQPWRWSFQADLARSAGKSDRSMFDMFCGSWQFGVQHKLNIYIYIHTCTMVILIYTSRCIMLWSFFLSYVISQHIFITSPLLAVNTPNIGA